MADTRPERRFTRIDRLPPYVFNITAELKMAVRRRGEDIIDFSMGNPDGATPPHIVEKLCTVAKRLSQKYSRRKRDVYAMVLDMQ